jgi:tetratricopeptide (TPR) repeat protein
MASESPLFKNYGVAPGLEMPWQGKPEESLFKLAFEKLELGHFDEVQSLCYQALDAQQNPLICAYGHFLLGCMHEGKGDILNAHQEYEVALSLNPEAPPPHLVIALANAYLKLETPSKAITLYQQALKQTPLESSYYFQLSLILMGLEQLQQAENFLKIGLKLNPQATHILYALGDTYKKMNQPVEAVEMYLQSLELDSNQPDVYFQLGNVLQQLNALYEGQTQEYLVQAISMYQAGLRLRPQDADGYYNLGNAFLKLEKIPEAEASYRNVIAIDPTHTPGWNNLGIVLRCQLKLDEAVYCYQQAIYHHPESIDAHSNIGVVMLMQGKLPEAWTDYEWRVLKNPFNQGVVQPLWQGNEQLKGKNLLVWAEGGYGDTFQYLRYLPLIKALEPSHITVVVQQGVLKLVEEGAPLNASPVSDSVNLWIEKGQTDTLAQLMAEKQLRFDYCVGSMSLPSVFKTDLNTIPSHHPYLFSKPLQKEKWANCIKDLKALNQPCLKIGIVWAGTVTVPSVLRRSCPIEYFFPLAKIPGVQLFSLQVGSASVDLQKAQAENVSMIDWTQSLTDFSETAGLLANLDLILSIDTGTIHLAGAMGLPVWVLLPFSPDWRWMLQREDSPWYPSMKLYRQESLGDWDSVFNKVTKDLAPLLPKSGDTSI